MAVYFIRCADAVKIGHARNVEKRLRDLQVGNPVELVVVRTVPGAAREEGWLHAHFRPHLIRAEWFRFVPEMLTIELGAAPPKVPAEIWPIVHRVSAQYGVKRGTSLSWQSRDNVPWRYRFEIAKAAWADGILVPDSFLPNAAIMVAA